MSVEAQWPSCPACNRPRTAACPVCGTSGTSFEPAETPLGESGEVTTVWLCPICDEVCEQPFLDRCEWCGHAFVAGGDHQYPAPVDDVHAGRLAWLLLGIGVVLVTLAAYFSSVLRR